MHIRLDFKLKTVPFLCVLKAAYLKTEHNSQVRLSDETALLKYEIQKMIIVWTASSRMKQCSRIHHYGRGQELGSSTRMNMQETCPIVKPHHLRIVLRYSSPQNVPYIFAENRYFIGSSRVNKQYIKTRHPTGTTSVYSYTYSG